MFGVPDVPQARSQARSTASGRAGAGRRADVPPMPRSRAATGAAGAALGGASSCASAAYVAVDKLSLRRQTGRITGLIGPNGAGKTTTFNVLSGLQRASGGRGVRVRGRDMTRRSPASRARAGIGRTFQKMELFDSLTVRENVAMGREGGLAGANPLRHVLSPSPASAAARRQATDEALALCGLEAVADATPGRLSTGQRRLVELARCLAGPFRILLLDEPSSGLDVTETERFGAILQRRRRQARHRDPARRARHVARARICDDIYVLDFGELIFTGTPDEVLASDIVRAAYLGDPEVEDAVDPTHDPELDAEAASMTTHRSRTESITAGYGRTIVLRDIDLAVGAGEVVALLGPNGAGKTTLLRAASGLLQSAGRGRQHQGRRHDAQAGRTQRARAGLCLIPEGRGIFADLSVKENLRLLVPPWEKAADIDRALNAFPILRERLDQRAGSMSGGQQQMLALARCWLCNPSVVLLDEVSMGLAPRIVDEIFEALGQLAGEGVALLVVEQYVDRALELADRVQLLDRGRTAFAGSTAEIDRDAILKSYLGAEVADVVTDDAPASAPSSDGTPE